MINKMMMYLITFTDQINYIIPSMNGKLQHKLYFSD